MFGDINPNSIRKALSQNDAALVEKEFLQRRYVFDLPTSHKGRWLRVRDNGTKTTLTYKETGTTIEERKEIEVTVSSLDETVELLQRIGCKATSFQESRREQWKLGGAEVTIDTWPHIDPFVEVEAGSAEEVENASTKIGLDYKKAIFESVNALYKRRYGKTIEDVSSQGFLSLAFDSPNPFT